MLHAVILLSGSRLFTGLIRFLLDVNLFYFMGIHGVSLLDNKHVEPGSPEESLPLATSGNGDSLGFMLNTVKFTRSMPLVMEHHSRTLDTQ